MNSNGTDFKAWNNPLIILTKQLGYPEHVPVERPNKIDVFMEMAFVASKRSTDAQTKHGCVILSPDFRVVSTGYNGFPRDIDISLLPNTRPHKYPWMKHAEKNALLWCPHRPVGHFAVVTGECCFDCLTDLWQAGIETIWEADRPGHSFPAPEEKLKRHLFLEMSSMRIHKVKIQDNWLK